MLIVRRWHLHWLFSRSNLVSCENRTYERFHRTIVRFSIDLIQLAQLNSTKRKENCTLRFFVGKIDFTNQRIGPTALERSLSNYHQNIGTLGLIQCYNLTNIRDHKSQIYIHSFPIDYNEHSLRMGIVTHAICQRRKFFLRKSLLAKLAKKPSFGTSGS